jgi:hypothetical protein
VGQDSVRRAWFADSQFSSGPDLAGLEAPEVLRDRVHRIKAGPANSVAVRIQPALRVRVAIRRAPAWEA